MTHEEIYGAILSDEGFLNDLWNRFGTTDKVRVLELSGWTIEQIADEFTKHQERQSVTSGEIHENEKQQEEMDSRSDDLSIMGNTD